MTTIITLSVDCRLKLVTLEGFLNWTDSVSSEEDCAVLPLDVRPPSPPPGPLMTVGPWFRAATVSSWDKLSDRSWECQVLSMFISDIKQNVWCFLKLIIEMDSWLIHFAKNVFPSFYSIKYLISYTLSHTQNDTADTRHTVLEHRKFVLTDKVSIMSISFWFYNVSKDSWEKKPLCYVR